MNATVPPCPPRPKPLTWTATNDARPQHGASWATTWRNGVLRQGELPTFGLLEAGLLPLGADLSQDGTIHGGDNVAESMLTCDKLVPRGRLRPGYGSGWQPG
jgi:hypothetical protein